MSMEERPPSRLSRLLRRVILGIYKSHGWRAEGVVPEPRRFVLIAAPHTSNWDFVYFLGLTDELHSAAFHGENVAFSVAVYEIHARYGGGSG